MVVTLVIPVLRRLRQERQKCQPSLGYGKTGSEEQNEIRSDDSVTLLAGLQAAARP